MSLRKWMVMMTAAMQGAGAAAAFSPLDLSPVLWLDAAQGVFTDAAKTTPAASDGDIIGAWADQSGNGNDFTQSTATKNPLLKLGANGINSLPAILFDGSNDILVASNFSSATVGSIFAVLSLSASPISTQTIIATSDEATAAAKVLLWRAYQDGISPNMFYYQNSAGTADQLRGNTNVVFSTTYIMELGSSGTLISMALNSVAQTLTVVGGANNGDWFGDSADRDNFSIGMAKWSAEAQPLKGKISELLIFPTNEVGNEDLRTYLNDKYAAF